ncbi:ankyrin repeat domain-containing protein [Dactylosporangium sp. NPDC050688]|uniref:ankyrin repeat domain-containing protein n=1 Tax=Dactylosporangium sp. NPDC050688 TaxID=3157217 RepID=UPI0033ED04E5
MFLAAAHGDTPEVHRLLDAGVDPRGVRGPQGQSLLHVAHRAGDITLIRRLRSAGVDPLAPDSLGWSAVRAAQTAGAPAPVIEALRTGPHND